MKHQIRDASLINAISYDSQGLRKPFYQQGLYPLPSPICGDGPARHGDGLLIHWSLTSGVQISLPALFYQYTFYTGHPVEWPNDTK